MSRTDSGAWTTLLQGAEADVEYKYIVLTDPQPEVREVVTTALQQDVYVYTKACMCVYISHTYTHTHTTHTHTGADQRKQYAYAGHGNRRARGVHSGGPLGSCRAQCGG